jgi:hypothetical protein
MIEDIEENEIEHGIPRFEFSSKRGDGWAEFVDIEDLTRREVKFLRKAAGSSENEGDAANNFFDEALRILVEKWEVPGKPDLRIPKHDVKGMDGIPAMFSAELEAHIRPYLKKLTRGNDGEDNGKPGSPHRPGRG